MAGYADKKINQGIGYKDTNVNVFMLASLPLNEVFEYGGVQGFFDKDTSGVVDFSRKAVLVATTFGDKKASVITSFARKTTATSTNFINKKTDE
jgi:hypothetical protein